ncbi:MAG: LuxR C-terminal-related transcriptional regulator, partial [Saprospiraceae bacterium]
FNHPNKQLVEFAYRINQGEFTLWQKNPDVVFNQLSPGKYAIELKAKNQAGVESPVILMNLTIKPPWYRSKMAYFLYFLSIAFILYWLAYRQKKKYTAEKKSIIDNSQIRERKHLMAVQESQEEIIRLQNEKLQAEIAFKNQELTSYTYHLVSKNELISEIKKAIQKLGPKFENDRELKKEFKTIMQLTDQNAGIDDDWDNFVKSFDQVHSEFFKRLTEKYTNLSSNDYKMCTYLRMNLTSKEIATLMNISIRSVETNRYRLRKKLGLHSEANLTQYLLRY